MHSQLKEYTAIYILKHVARESIENATLHTWKCPKICIFFRLQCNRSCRCDPISAQYLSCRDFNISIRDPMIATSICHKGSAFSPTSWLVWFSSFERSDKAGDVQCCVYCLLGCTLQHDSFADHIEYRTYMISGESCVSIFVAVILKEVCTVVPGFMHDKNISEPKIEENQEIRLLCRIFS